MAMYKICKKGVVSKGLYEYEVKFNVRDWQGKRGLDGLNYRDTDVLVMGFDGKKMVARVKGINHSERLDKLLTFVELMLQDVE